MSDTLDQWEKDAALCSIPECNCDTEWNKRIRILIDLIRKKDESFEKIFKELHQPFHRHDILKISCLAASALKLTEEL